MIEQQRRDHRRLKPFAQEHLQACCRFEHRRRRRPEVAQEPHDRMDLFLDDGVWAEFQALGPVAEVEKRAVRFSAGRTQA
jgi:hypothetical protein